MVEKIKVNASVLRNLFKPAPDSYKGQNGVLTIIGGSRKYHGAPILAVRAATRFVDYVFFHSPEKQNNELARKLKEHVCEVIVVEKKELAKTIARSDCVLVGNGMSESRATKRFIEGLLKKFVGKKFVLDAAALRVVDARLLSRNVLVAPHVEEFRSLFGTRGSEREVVRQARARGCVILLKGRVDLITDGKRLAFNRTGNAGMTKGGTGDVLAGLAAALACKNNLFLAAQAAAFANGAAGDLCFKEKGFYYNAGDVIEAIPRAFKKALR